MAGNSGPVLVPVGDFPEDLLEKLSRRAKMPVSRPFIDLAPAWNPARRQYDSSCLLAELKRAHPGEVVGAAAVDLFVPVLTFVFGEAEMPGRAAIFSIHRLREEFYGLPRNPALLESRAIRELWHEYGHTQGLAHCEDWSCVMTSSHSVTQVDLKSEHFCAACAARLRIAGARKRLERALDVR